jgi:myo-inositol 2-dehydrogenase/D-chiro-inositol 1-dehydrogenase
VTATRVAIVGAGSWGNQHLRAFTAAHEVDVVGVCGRTPDRVGRRASRYGVAPFTDLDRMLDETRPDLVSLCLPNQSHFEPTMHVLQHSDAAVLTEKPLVFDLREADALLDAAGSDRFFAVCFNHRYARAAQLAKAAVDDGRLGDMVLATWRFGGEGTSDHPHGNLIETQCHGFDQLEWMAGPISSVAATMRNQTIVVSVAFDRGAVGSLVGSYDDSYTHPGAHRLELVGTRGRAVIDDTVRRFTFNQHGSELAEVWEPGYFNDRDRQFTHTMDAYVADLVRALRASEPPPVPATAGRRALSLAHACIASNERGERIATPRN